uniref:SR-related CTD-associated factor 4a n=1 Tax=Hippocampus comes TaxID=109280 RepID=A0A3Q2YRN7_HIPCM
MDAVNAFNQELFSLMDSKPPISRAKMISITKSAIKAMKLYKHVVQIVEKFIKKCKSEYKVAGLYVVDSIVRQSRHQFGADKDVFGPRFTKNIVATFENLCLCPMEDRSKLVRVLNLWQKNGVFKSNVIQPLLDMAAGASSDAAPCAEDPGDCRPHAAVLVLLHHAVNSAAAPCAPLQKQDPFTAVAQLFQSTQGQQVRLEMRPFLIESCSSRSPKRRRSRSNSRTRRSRHRRSRSRSRDRRHHSPRSRSQERRERERDRERRQKGLPPPKSETLSICSTTLWVGQLDKRTQQQDVASLLEEFGQIESINMIPPRGCAYIVMVHRQDAFRALQKLSRGSYKVNQKAIKIAWALNKGIKAELKQFWDVELGVTYLPWSKVREEQLEELKEGGILDGDTLAPGSTQMSLKYTLLSPCASLPGFPPPGAMPLSMPPPPPSKGDDMPLVSRKHEEVPDAPNFSIQPQPGGLLGARPGMIPLQRPPGPPPLHVQRFPPPPVPPQMVPRGPHPPPMRHDTPPPKGAFGMPHSMRPPFPPHGPPPQGPPPHGLPPQGPPPQGPPPQVPPHQGPPPQGPTLPSPPFIRPGAPRVIEDDDGRPFRGERSGFREREPERERGFGGATRRPFGGDRSDARDRLDGGGWDRDRRDWRDRENGSREAQEKGKEGERPKRRERASRWDRDDRLAELDKMDKVRTLDAVATGPAEAPQKTVGSAPPAAESSKAAPPSVEAK